jgi:hypothetical protein
MNPCTSTHASATDVKTVAWSSASQPGMTVAVRFLFLQTRLAVLQHADVLDVACSFHNMYTY